MPRARPAAGGAPQEEVTFAFQKLEESLVTTSGKIENVGLNVTAIKAAR